MRKEVIIPALGWIVAGAICIILWKIEIVHPSNLIFLGILVIIVGVSLLLLNKRILKIVDTYKSKAEKH